MSTAGAWVWRVGLLGILLFPSCRDPAGLRRVEATARLDPPTVDFGAVAVGTSKTSTVTVKNEGRVPFRLEGAFFRGLSPEFSLSIEETTLAPGSTQAVELTFLPARETPYTEEVLFKTDADEALEALQVSGRGAPSPIVLSPARIDFETLEVDSMRRLSVRVENPVGRPVQLELKGPDAALFSLSERVVAPFSSQEISIAYSPARLGAHEALLSGRVCADCTEATATMVGQSVASAFVFSPDPVPFEEVPVHASSFAQTVARNVTWRAVEVQSFVASDSFSVTSSTTPSTVPSGGTLTIGLQYAARVFGPDEGQLALLYVSSRPGQSTVRLDARGGRAQLAVTPASLDFGEWPVGAKTARRLRLTNAGQTGNLLVLGFRGEGDTAGFGVSAPRRGAVETPWLEGSLWPVLNLTPMALTPGDDAIDVEVYFEPLAPGAFSGSLVVVSDDLFHPERVVALSGRARASGPCTFVVSPSVIDFGNVPVGRGAVLGFQFRNSGSTECAVKDIAISESAGGAFFMPGGPIVGGAVPFDSAFSAQVAFRSPVAGAFEGAVSLTVNSADTPVVRLPLKALAQTSCLLATPGYLDFGAVRYDCSIPEKSTTVLNRCPFPIDISDVRLGEGTSAQFSFEAQPPPPSVLLPGEGFEITAQYSRTVHGQHQSPLFVDSPQETGPFLIPLLAETNHEGLTTDTFVQGDDEKLDVLMVVSNTSTMGRYQERLAQAIPSLWAEATALGLDLQVGVTSSGLFERSDGCPGGARGGENGRLFPVDGQSPRWVNARSPEAILALQRNIRVGTCHNLVQSLEAMRSALSPPLSDMTDDPRTPAPNDGNLGFVRPSAQLAVLFLSDEDDRSGFSTASYVEFLRALKGATMAQRVSAWSIVPTDTRCLTAGGRASRFLQLSADTEGEALSICSARYDGWLSGLLRRVARRQEEFVLSATPSSIADLEVSVDGTQVASTLWRYDARRNAVQLTGVGVPLPGQTLTVRYRSACP